MSDGTTATTTETPAAAVAAPAAPPPAAPPAPAPAAPAAAAAPVLPPERQPIGITADQLSARLKEEREKAATRAAEETRAAILKDLGATPEEAKNAVKRARELEEAQKSEVQKALDRALAAEKKAARVADLETIITNRLAVEEAALTDAQRSAVKALAGDDAAGRLRAIDALKPTWTAAVAAPPAVVPAAPVAAPIVAPPATPVAAPPIVAAPPAAPAPLPAPISTVPAATAPVAPPVAVVDHLQVLKDLEAFNPMRAAAYKIHYAAEISAAKASQTHTARP